ncbi:MAG: rhomboid family intramembrane serine protease, partial [Planctomycetaceae bacterium]|nr:rhomboid family intramembrane serine protease [Planctomycetaceae bacterium]
HGLYRFITGSLLHANYHHLLANVFALFCLLRLLEPKERLVHLVGLYLTGCIVGFGMAYFGKSQIVIGVSGVAFCYATYLILKRHYGINNDIVLASFLAMFVLEMIIGALVPYVSTLTHVGGAIGGILYFLIRYNIDSSFTSYSDDNGKQESLPS